VYSREPMTRGRNWGSALRGWAAPVGALAVVLVATGLAHPGSDPWGALGARAATHSGASLAPYRGLGGWVDVYDHEAFADPAAAVATMAAHGVRTLYLETSNWKRPYAVVRPAKQAQFIEAAHAKGLRVVAWYLPLFQDVGTDFRRVMRGIRFETPGGQGFDSFALDIEANQVEPTTRIANMLELSARLREAVGPAYALGGIIPSPSGMVRVPEYWPGFPYAELPAYYDVILPMSYWTFHYDGAGAAKRYITDNIRIVREQTGIPSIPIHVIGGVTADTNPREARAFVRAANEAGVLGASLYEYAGMTVELWSAMSRIQVTTGAVTEAVRARQSRAIPPPTRGGFGIQEGQEKP
jgi:hypothetical protein